jgi:hypothetical protein
MDNRFYIRYNVFCFRSWQQISIPCYFCTAQKYELLYSIVKAFQHLSSKNEDSARGQYCKPSTALLFSTSFCSSISILLKVLCQIITGRPEVERSHVFSTLSSRCNVHTYTYNSFARNCSENSEARGLGGPDKELFRLSIGCSTFLSVTRFVIHMWCLKICSCIDLSEKNI